MDANMNGWDSSDEAPEYFSHVSADGTRFEPVGVHLEEVATMAAEFARPFGAEGCAYNAGSLHDLGKYTHEFQDRILRDGPRVDHSTAGALCAYENKLWLPAHCIAGHHSGLLNTGSPIDEPEEGTLWGRLNKAKRGKLPKLAPTAPVIRLDTSPVPVAVDNPVGDVDTAPVIRLDPSLPQLDVWPVSKDTAFCLSFLTRMVHSCVVDADFLCTEAFMLGHERMGLAYEDLDVLLERFEAHIAVFFPPRTNLNALRCELLDSCQERAHAPRGLFGLTAPTGSGKTLAMMRFALTHACEPGNGMRRVIVVEPYTAIIDQVADVYRGVFGDENVLEHHSNFDFNDLDDDGFGPNGESLGARLRLAAENWDAPIIVTTSVQFFESLFAKSTSRCRKLHNIPGSVIVLDEAQSIPREVLLPCVKALSELVKNYKCSVVLASATQPALDEYFEDEGLPISNIVPDEFSQAPEFERVRYRSLSVVEPEELAERLSEEPQAICIVNSRKQALRIHDLLSSSSGVDCSSLYHLSTLMYPDHRRRVLDEVTERLRHPGTPCLVVSTSLVEAGVDLDFPVVYRAFAGVDSMVQAAGRCNREGRRPVDESSVWLFELDSDDGIPREVAARAGIAKTLVPGLMKRGSEVCLDDPRTIHAFFTQLYHIVGRARLDGRNVLKLIGDTIGKDVRIQFVDIARAFKLIDQEASSVIVPTHENAEDVKALQDGTASRETMRRLSRFGVSVYGNDLRKLLALGVVENIGGTYILLDPSRYREDVGLDVRVDGGGGMFL